MNEQAKDQISVFIDDILASRDVSGLNQAVIDQMHADLRNELLNQIDRQIIEELSEDQAAAFTELCNKPETTEQDVETFMANSGLNREQIAVHTMVKFREYYLGDKK
jgi:hypothetical protein